MIRLSLRLPDELLQEIDTFANEMHIPRSAYVRKAIEQMNMAVAAQRRGARLMEVSQKVRSESMKVNADFSKIEDVPHAFLNTICSI